jgi:hypothetical protein
MARNGLFAASVVFGRAVKDCKGILRYLAMRAGVAMEAIGRPALRAQKGRRAHSDFGR